MLRTRGSGSVGRAVRLHKSSVAVATCAPVHVEPSAPKMQRHKDTALSDQCDPTTYTLHGAYYLKDRDGRPKVWYRMHAPSSSPRVPSWDGGACVGVAILMWLYSGMVWYGMVDVCVLSSATENTRTLALLRTSVTERCMRALATRCVVTTLTSSTPTTAAVCMVWYELTRRSVA